MKSTFHFNVADSHLRVRRFPEAAAGFVIRLSPDHPAAYVKRGVALQGMNDHRRAVDDLDRAIRRMSSFSPAHRTLAYYGRGVSWKLIGHFDRAAADYEQALAIDPRFSPAHDELGVLATCRQDFDAAVAHVSRG